LTLQNRVAGQEARIADALRLISQAREDVLNRLFVKDSPAIWSTEVRSHAPQDLLEETRTSFYTQWTTLLVYAERQTVRFFLHAAVFIALATGFYWARRRMRSRVTGDAGPADTALVFDMPIAVALMLSFLSSRWIYPQPPRLLFLAEMFGGVLFLVWLIPISRPVVPYEPGSRALAQNGQGRRLGRTGRRRGGFHREFSRLRDTCQSRWQMRSLAAPISHSSCMLWSKSSTILG
jgi:hypothetical protein